MAFDTEIHFLDVGQGASTVVLLPNNGQGPREALVIDSADDVTTIDCLRRCGVERIRLILVTHSDNDHAAGIPGLVRAFLPQINTIALNLDSSSLKGKLWFSELQHHLKVAKRVRRSRPRLDAAQAPATIAQLAGLDGTDYGEILHPTAGNVVAGVVGGDVNYCSSVVALRVGAFRTLLGADLSLKGWSVLWERLGCRRDVLRAHVFQFSHHGAELEQRTPGFEFEQPSPTVLTELEVLEAVHPQLVIISVGTKQPPNYQHPRSATFALLAEYRERNVSMGDRFRIACTELTGRCLADPLTLRADSLDVKRRQGQMLVYATDDARACPCAGTVVVRAAAETGAFEHAADAAHQEFVDLVEARGGTPRCRVQTAAVAATAVASA